MSSNIFIWIMLEYNSNLALSMSPHWDINIMHPCQCARLINPVNLLKTFITAIVPATCVWIHHVMLMCCVGIFFCIIEQSGQIFILILCVYVLKWCTAIFAVLCHVCGPITVCHDNIFVHHPISISLCRISHTIGVSHCTVGALWTAGQQVVRSILHLG